MAKPEDKPDKPGKPDKPPIEPPIEPVEPPPQPIESTGWQTFKLGAGGQLSSIDITADGTKVIRADTLGCYWYDTAAPNPGNAGGTGCWQQLVSEATLPTPEMYRNAGGGGWEIRIAPSLTTRFYMYHGGDSKIYRTDDRGKSWTTCGALPGGPYYVAANDGTSKFVNYKMAVDPDNADKVIVATPKNGIFVSADAGVSWAAIADVAPGSAFPGSAGEYAGNTIAFVDSALVYAGTYGVGVYQSSDGGASWTLLDSANMPVKPGKLRVDSNGVLYVADWSDYSLWKYDGTAWVNVHAGLTGHVGFGVAINPANPLQMFTGDSGSWYYSIDGGANWSYNMTGPNTKTDTDIPYLGTIIPFTVSNVVWGPDDIIYIADGVGVWQLRPADIPMTSYNHPPLTSISIGIEQLVVNWIQSKPSNSLQIICMDRGVFVVDDQSKYPLTCKSQAISVADINEGYSIDYAANDPAFSIALVGEGFTPYGVFYIIKSHDNGATWVKAASNPPGIIASGGCVAALTATNWLWVEANGWNAASNYGGRVYYTKDGGSSWAEVSTPGLAVGDGFFGPPSTYSLRRQIAVADRVNGNFYLYNSGSVAPGIWRSTDGGANFTRVCTTRLDGGAAQDAWNCQFRPLPPYPGYLGGEMYATGGIEDPGNPGSALYECKDIGSSVTMTAIQGPSHVWSVGFGAPKPDGDGYPAVFIYGVVDGGQGVWRSDDHCASWTKLTPTKFVNGSLDQINVIEGDLNVYGKCYIGFAGSGVAVYDQSQA